MSSKMNDTFLHNNSKFKNDLLVNFKCKTTQRKFNKVTMVK